MVYAEESTPNKTTATVAHAEELPYFAEKYPGKVCCLCNLCERSALGQGDLLRIPINTEKLANCYDVHSDSLSSQTDDAMAASSEAINQKKLLAKGKVTINDELINELDHVGYEDVPSIKALVSECAFVYVHSKCAMWAMQIKRIEENAVTKFEEVVGKCLQSKCSYCLRFGASVNCRMNCSKVFHLPCAAASGCFLIIESFHAFCLEHVNQVPYIAVDKDIECRHCCSLGDISKLLMCSACGAHYHTNCVGLANFPDSRSGWTCQQCCKCLICREADNTENRSIKCEQCHKLYHTTCLRPIISSVPKYGWKCNRCRNCSDCGARTPGAGASSRWHCHYTICDSCYQQRNKGFSCPICHKAYRAASHKEMVKCSNCNRFVHGNCDEEADLTTYHSKKETNPDYDYVCPPCKSGKQQVILSSGDCSSVANDFSRDLDTEFNDKDPADCTNLADPLKMPKKKAGCKDFARTGKVGKLVISKSSLLSSISRKRSVRGKGRQLLLLNPTTLSSTGTDSAHSQCSEEEMSLEKKMILCSAKDRFILMQDICVMCGSLGTDIDACLISCVQCGQCYHPHCVNVVLSKTMLQKGWRCLDCTVCEGCGQKNDEARLILCDECDISYHIYCMNPPLDAVPNGNWKCKLCALCQKCGRNSPGKHSHWFNGFLECGPCASQKNCCVCTLPYSENDLIIQCNSCERWLHCLCDNIKDEGEANAFHQADYSCKMCRDKVVSNASAVKNATVDKAKKTHPLNNCSNTTAQETAASGAGTVLGVTENSDPVGTTFSIDGVYVSEQGFNMIRSLTTEIKKKRKLKSESCQKEASMAASTDSATGATANGAQGSTESSSIGGEKTQTVVYKDGMLWSGEDGTQPEGFSISTNEEGHHILRKKRQRNLQKLGIGGFNVRARGIRKENEDSVQNTVENTYTPDEKKKKIVKKKFKSKLCESYPNYLQEAFFGKALLENKETTSVFESDSSDDALAINDKEDVLNLPPLLQQCCMKSETTQIPQTDSEAPKEARVKAEEGYASISNVYTSRCQTEDVASKPPDTVDNISVENPATEQKHNVDVSYLKTESSLCDRAFAASARDKAPSSGKHGIPQNCLGTPAAMGNINQQQQQQQYLRCDSRFAAKRKPASQYLNQQSENPLLSEGSFEKEVKVSDVMATNERLVSEGAEPAVVLEEAVKEPAVPGTQKTAEKMRKDEDLGEMATISAVLYANTQHPDLKQLYPNWNERCKQILKMWRSLSTEMKAPFLQHAKDNRSVLRLRRSQQEPEKTYFQQKSLKEQEQERVWKQHQAKNKESASNKASKSAHLGDLTRQESVSSAAGTSGSQQQLFELNFLQDSSDTKDNPGIVLAADHTSRDTCEGAEKSERREESQQPLFLSALTDQIQSQTGHDPTIVDISKVFETKKSECMHLGLTERNELFLNEKQWTNVAKAANTKETLALVAEKLDVDENAGLGDILGGFGEGDDDAILKSLTAEIGEDFNILEYADPELDEINSAQNLLNKLDFDENHKAL